MANIGHKYLSKGNRSNKGNKVGYPESLRSAGRVALGTDGYPAVMAEEAELLAEHESDTVVQARLQGSQTLATQLFDELDDFKVVDDQGVRHVVVGGEVVVQDYKLVRGDIEQIREQAEREAARLWQRMERL